MRKRLPKILVTGGAGFIGSALVRYILKMGPEVTVIDKLSYAGDLKRLEGLDKKYTFYKADICDYRNIESIFKRHKPSIIVNFAAETHVDRSILDSKYFLETNIFGTKILLDIARKFGVKEFIHISTDEVYGDIKKGKFSEDSSLNPSSPYSATKAAADLLIKSYIRTYSFPAIIIRPCNNYGPWQYPEKLIPLSILKIIRKEKIPVYAKGENVREWLYVEDCARGIFEILKKGKIGEVYNLGSGQEKNNLEVVKLLIKILNATGNMVQFVKDRPGHDIRYSLNSEKLRNEIGWRPKVKFEDGVKLTVNWCLKHKDWLLSKWQDIAHLYK
jgi:dTDP-glucose 4,6-dehydratase